MQPDQEIRLLVFGYEIKYDASITLPPSQIPSIIDEFTKLSIYYLKRREDVSNVWSILQTVGGPLRAAIRYTFLGKSQHKTTNSTMVSFITGFEETRRDNKRKA